MSPGLHLIIFDIDGTLIHPHVQEVACFEQALLEVAGITHISKDLLSYQHVTETGIVQECIDRQFNRPTTSQELAAVERRFLSIFQKALINHPPTPLLGVHALFQHLRARKDIALGIATGTYLHSALLKLHHCALPLSDLPIASCNDSIERVEIMKIALQKALHAYQVPEFKSITYIGDGPWDIKAVKELDWKFIGVASQYSEETLRKLGADQIVKHYSPLSHFLEHLTNIFI